MADVSRATSRRHSRRPAGPIGVIGALLATVVFLAATLVAAPGPVRAESAGGATAAVRAEMAALDAGSFHTCQLDGGRVICWGRNVDGELGDGNVDVPRSRPVLAAGLIDAVEVAAGSASTCARRVGGSIACWGHNSGGQVGDGTTIPRPTPTPVSGIENATALAGGWGFNCAALDDGTVRCWGYNTDGQLGDGTTTTRSTPVTVVGITDAVGVSASLFHTCALLADGTVRCWGRNTSGQLGDGTNVNRSTPVAVDGVAGATAISAGSDHTCAVIDDGTIRCWGRDGEGRLGDGPGNGGPEPVEVSGIDDAVAVAAGDAHSCALLADGGLRCWGSNYDGRLGDGTTTDRPAPVVVIGAGSARSITVGYEHSCAGFDDGTTRCWGRKTHGQLGDAELPYRPTPVDVIGVDDARSIDAGYDSTCAVMGDGTVDCWGGNRVGQLGDGTRTDRPIAITVPGLTDVVQVGVSDLGTIPHGCARRQGGAIACWGDNSFSELGDGTTETRTTPVGGTGITTATEITVGGSHTCALLPDGTVECWGANFDGQLGDGTTVVRRPAPVPVVGISDAVAIAAGGSHTCAVLEDGTVRCWGWNWIGQLGDGTTTDRTTPVAVVGLTGVVAIAAAGNSTCALVDDGTIACWGNNGSGQLGDGTTTARTSPVTVVGITDAVEIDRGGSHGCARLAGGTMQCWGWNFSGQLGDGTTTNRTTPVTVAGLGPTTAIAAGGSHSCAVVPGGAVECWGAVGLGQLGNGTLTYRTTPTTVDLDPARHRLTLLPAPCPAATGPLEPGVPVRVELTGVCGLPAAGVSAAVVSLTAVDPTGAGNLRVSAAGTVPAGGVVNYAANGLDNTNTLTVPLAADGAIDLAANNASTSYRLVVIGYHRAGGTLTYHPVTPCAVSDSRPGQGATGAFVGPFAAGAAVPDVDVVGSFPAGQGGGSTDCGIPAGAEAVMLNVVAVAATGGRGGLAVGPGGSDPVEPTTNLAPIGLNNAASMLVPLDGGQTVATSVVASTGGPSTHVRLVALGYLDDDGDDYAPVNPCAIFDSRNGQGAAGPFLGPRTAGTATTYQITGAPDGAQGGAAAGCGIPDGATAVLVNLVAIRPSAVGNLRAYATGTSPTGGVLNFAPTDPAMNNSNAIVVPLSGDGRLDLYVNAPSNDGQPTTEVRGVVLGYYG